MAKKTHISMRLDNETLEYVEYMARRENRSVSNMIYTLLTKAVMRDKQIHKQVKA